MSDLSLPPIDFTPVDRPGAAPTPAAGRGFRWPTPPFAAYPSAAPLAPGEPCEVEGHNGSVMTARLLAFDPAEGVCKVLAPPARAAVPLRFDQFRRLTLTQPLRPLLRPSADPYAAILDHRPSVEVRLRLAGGSRFQGRSVGHAETAEGLFLFAPHDEHGAVLRVFVPRGAYDAVEFGPRLGEALVEQQAATPEQIEQAAAEQARLRERKLGDILVAQRIVAADQLIEAIEQQARMPMVRIGEALLALGLVTAEQLDAALEQQQADRSVPLGQILVRMGFVTREDLQLALARKMGYPVVDVSRFAADVEAVRRLPYAVASRFMALPLLLRGSRLVVAMEDPSRRDAVDELEFAAQAKIVPVLAPAAQIERVLASVYERYGMDTARTTVALDPGAPIDFEPQDASRLVETLEAAHADAERDDDGSIEQSDNSLVRLIHTMIVDAFNQGVSDIHVETQPGREKLRIRFRKDGALRPYLELPHTYRQAVVARLKIMCDLDISERRKPQDGKINFARYSPQHRLELRVATIPTHHGLEDVVLRLLVSAKPMPLDQIDLSEDNLGRLRAAAERPYGLVLVVGPTGSGKTTTLHSVLAHLNTADRKIWTAEDPIEITQKGLRQVQVNPRIDWTFARALRAFLRADPDVIMVGEIRDHETAQTAIEASLTGHLVLSTLHTNGAAESVTRLLDMGMDPFNFGDSLLAVLAQRLVRRLCPHCRQRRAATDDEADEWIADWLHALPGELRPSADAVRAAWTSRWGHDGQLPRYDAPGCTQCEGSGLRGRLALHELLGVERELRRLIHTRASAEQIQHAALAEGMRTLRQDGIEKVLQGLTRLDEVRATTNA